MAMKLLLMQYFSLQVHYIKRQQVCCITYHGTV